MKEINTGEGKLTSGDKNSKIYNKWMSSMIDLYAM